MNKTVSSNSKGESPAATKGMLPLLKIIWFSCLFFLVLFSFYAWKLFIVEEPRILPWYFMALFYTMGVSTYVLAELIPTWKVPQGGKIPPEFSTMISYSLFEAVGLYGLVFAVLVQSFPASFLFLMAAFIGLIRHRPKPV